MTIPYWINILLCVIAFVVALLEYYMVDPTRRVFNLYFGLAAGAVLMALVNIFMKDPSASPWLFLLALGWCGTVLYQLRRLPARPDAV